MQAFKPCLVGPFKVIAAAASPGLRSGGLRLNVGTLVPSRVIFVSLCGEEGLSDTVIKPGSCVGGPGSILSELAENEGLTADRQLVAPSCLKGGSRALFLPARYRWRCGECAHLKETIGNVSIWLGAAGRRLGTPGAQPGGPGVQAARGETGVRGFGLREASPRTSPGLEVIRAARRGGDHPRCCRRGCERPVSSAPLGIGCYALGTEAQRTSGPGSRGSRARPQSPGSFLKKGRSCIFMVESKH